jgi:hypothetical protein
VGSRPALGQPKVVPGAKPLIEIQHSVSFLPSEKVNFAVNPLRDGPMPARTPAPAAEAPYCVRHYSSNAANSRLAGVLPEGQWSVKWSAGLRSEPLSIIRSGDRIVCQWSGEWFLFDGNGKQIREGYCGNSPVVIDPNPETFQLITDSLSWEVRRLDSGELAFRNALPYNEDYSWPVLFRAGTRLIAFANVRPAFQHGPREKGSSLLQLLELGMPIETDPGMLVRNLKRFETLQIGAESSRAAAENGFVAMAAPDVLVRFDSNLQVVGAFSGTFTPRQIAIDESDWIYLFATGAVGTGGGKAVWVLTPAGVRVAAWSLPVEVADPIQPPILGYDRRIYLLTSAQLVALDPGARLLWVKPVPGGAVGAGVTIDGRVLVSSSRALLAFQPNGEYRELYKFEDSVTTPPVYTSHHEILVGAGKKLYCLANRPGR